VIRASIVVVSHLGQGGRLMIMVLALDEAGAQHSQSPMDADGGTVISKICCNAKLPCWSIQLTFRKNSTMINELWTARDKMSPCEQNGTAAGRTAMFV
jgi:hypothetical protein